MDSRELIKDTKPMGFDRYRTALEMIVKEGEVASNGGVVEASASPTPEKPSRPHLLSRFP